MENNFDEQKKLKKQGKQNKKPKKQKNINRKKDNKKESSCLQVFLPGLVRTGTGTP